MKLGILGGGQLAQMLALRAWELGMEPWILSPSSRDPAALVTRFWVRGSTNRESHVLNFSKQVDALTFESEFVPEKILKSLARRSLPIFPRPEILLRLQNRRTQKAWLDVSDLPSSPWSIIQSKQDLEIARRQRPHGVLKKSLGGYDGYGTWALPPGPLPKSVEKLFEEPFDGIYEAWVPFRRELALSFICGAGKILSLPLVETRQKDFRCHWVKGPLKHPQQRKLAGKIQSALTKLKYRGAITFELFETSQGELWVNEVAPRVHNSAHVTQIALQESQFGYHLRAGLGLELPPAELLAPGFAMLNLIGGESPEDLKLPLPCAEDLHWYHKKEQKRGRKLGHINSLGKNPQQALRKAQKSLHKSEL